MLFVFLRVILDAIRHLPTREARLAFTCLSVPEFDVPVVATAEELCARVVEVMSLTACL